MNRPLIPFAVLLLVSLATSAWGADVKDKTAFCARQAQDITNEIVQKILPDLGSEQRNRVEAAADRACMKLITADPNLAGQSAGDGSTDWFTKYVLSGKPANKPGNQRLRDLK